KASLATKGTVSRGNGAGEYLARSWWGTAGNLFRSLPRRVVGWRAGGPRFHPARVLYLTLLDLDLRALWRAATHPPSVLRPEPRGSGGVRHVSVPAGLRSGSR